MQTTNEYYGTKKVTAWPEEKEGKPGYAVKYVDGYLSWSPKEVFEAAYQPLDALSFGHAIEALKAGQLVARSGWNGKGMYLLYVSSGNWECAFQEVNEQETKRLRDFIAMKTVDNELVPWLASQTDILANDWQIV